MKRILFIALVGLCSVPVFAQDVLDNLADDACECISQKDTDKMSMEELQMQLSMCLMESVGENQEAFQKEYGELDPTDQAGMQAFGQKVAMKMVNKCPQVMMKMASTGQVPPQAGTPSAGKTAAAGKLTGTIQDISGDEVAIVTVKEQNGRTHKLLWLGYFEGSDRLQGGSKVVGTEVEVMYEELEVYSPKAQEYFERKKITGVKFD